MVDTALIFCLLCVSQAGHFYFEHVYLYGGGKLQDGPLIMDYFLRERGMPGVVVRCTFVRTAIWSAFDL